MVEAVCKAAQRGLSFGAPSAAETELAQLITARVPACEQVRLVSTGTEATMTAIRLARGVTGRDLIIKFAGCYHGHSDGLLAAAGSGVATQGLPGSAGVTSAVASETIVLPYNDLPALQKAFDTYPKQIAAVITESCPANMGVVPPLNQFNLQIRQLTTQYGALMITDEVLTGFRCSPSGFWGLENGFSVDLPAQLPAFSAKNQRREWLDEQLQGLSYVPDIFTFGKVIGGGMPLAALGGAAKIMQYLAPDGPVYQAGTLSGNPVATAAGIATLQAANQQVYQQISTKSAELQQRITNLADQIGVPLRINCAGSLFSVFFGYKPQENGVANYAQAQDQNVSAYRTFFHSLLEQGVYLPPSAFEAWFISSAHDEKAMETIYSALPAALAAAREQITQTD